LTTAYPAAAVSTRKTASPTQRSIHAPSAISAKYPIVSQRKRNAAASERSGFATYFFDFKNATSAFAFACGTEWGRIVALMIPFG
jgi:hypothetical protein